MKQEIKHFVLLAETVSRILYPLAEVVIHDLKKDRICAIFNSISNRKVEDPSFLERMGFQSSRDLPDIIGPYEKINYDGRPLKSISLVIRDKQNLAVGFLCINLDISIFSKYHTILNTFLTSEDSTLTEKNKCLFKDDLYEQINVFVQKYCLENKLNLNSLSRLQKKDLILELQNEGALLKTNASQYIARVLGVSRATVYNYLKHKATYD